ncbi:hypothetical protein QJS10_CPA08g00541 [Acorus calamus]|uniref:DEAD/DEAH-box helicase domain-containing protein n=1 Tax=Acorus calamus TaxID=4465 RepID=A0AAV9E9K5_ACOCL|nr:hypothetical protein QJS10_CPA08g00541 [Acorus calamus]
MAKGDDALRRKKNKSLRKKASRSSTVSTRVAAIIASKKRRKSGLRRMCQGMCFSLPTPDDPFNDRFDKDHNLIKNKPKSVAKTESLPVEESPKRVTGGDGSPESLSKFLIMCVKEIQDAWVKEGSFDSNVSGFLLASSWGIEFWKSCRFSGLDMLVKGRGDCLGREHVAWVVSTASDMVAGMEKDGLTIANPFLLYIVPSHEKAVQVRAVCKPLKALGVHTVSLHEDASLDHQVRGLKSCEPEFVVSTPERLIELVSLGAIDISDVSLLVLDGLESFVKCGFAEKITAIRKHISGKTQTVAFNDCSARESVSLVKTLLRGSVCRLSIDDPTTTKKALKV